jgi:hypothetical protein
MPSSQSNRYRPIVGYLLLFKREHLRSREVPVGFLLELGAV